VTIPPRSPADQRLFAGGPESCRPPTHRRSALEPAGRHGLSPPTVSCPAAASKGLGSQRTDQRGCDRRLPPNPTSVCQHRPRLKLGEMTQRCAEQALRQRFRWSRWAPRCTPSRLSTKPKNRWTALWHGLSLNVQSVNSCGRIAIWGCGHPVTLCHPPLRAARIWLSHSVPS
jgi:hypothetical protein